MYRKIQRRDYKFPSWISKPVRSIVYKLLDPNPESRMSVEAVMETTWFKRSLEVCEFQSGALESDDRLAKPRNEMVTAFDLIVSLSHWLDFSGLFKGKKKKEKRFTAKVSAEGVMEKARKIGEKLGFRVEKKRESMVVGLGKGRTTVVVEAVDLLEGLVVAEVKVAEGEEEEEAESYWSELIVEFEEIVLTWHTDKFEE